MDVGARRLYDARRTSLINRLVREGGCEDDAEALFDRWEAEADHRGLSRLSAAFWMQADDWTAAELDTGKGGSHGPVRQAERPGSLRSWNLPASSR